MNQKPLKNFIDIGLKTLKENKMKISDDNDYLRTAIYIGLLYIPIIALGIYTLIKYY